MSGRKEEIEVEINGESQAIVGGLTLRELLERHGPDPRAVAIEHNGAIVARRDFGETRLEDGDQIEIVRFVQGG